MANFKQDLEGLWRCQVLSLFLEQFSGWGTGHQAPLSFEKGPGVRFPHCATYTNRRTAVIIRISHAERSEASRLW